jgi:hypothetical protein
VGAPTGARNHDLPKQGILCRREKGEAVGRGGTAGSRTLNRASSCSYIAVSAKIPDRSYRKRLISKQENVIFIFVLFFGLEFHM